MKLEEYLIEIEAFLQNYLTSSHCSGYVLGISGGVDSSLVALLTKHAVGKEKLLGVIIPIKSNPNDIKDAISLCENYDINYEIINLDDTYDEFIKSFLDKGIELDDSTKGNLKARMRMSTLYAFAQKRNALVVGTDNADERYTGYFTKYGDGGVDVLPIVHLLKSEVVKSAILYGVNDHLANKTPSADLFEGQTDEKEMGVTYKDLDNYLLGKQVNDDTKHIIERLHRISEHKRSPIPCPGEFKRDE